MRSIQKFSVILLFLIWCFDPSGGVTHGTSCGGYFRKATVGINGDNLGYCWWFLNYNFSAKRAFEQCKAFRARQTAVTTPGKARKLSLFMKDNIKLYGSGKKGARYKAIFGNGWPKGEVWVSAINDGHWKSTQRKVTDAATEEADIKKHGRQCVVFSHRKSTWRYASCSETHPTICEDINHTYPDDVGADDWTTPSVTLPPTRPHPKGLKLTCPEGYDEFMRHCFYIGKKRESLIDADKRCYETGGYQVWISDSSKDTLVQRYVRANKKKFPPPFYTAWLGRLEGNGYIIKWKGPETNARYIINKNHLYMLKGLKKGILPNLYMNSKGRVSRCGDRCSTKAAFCESTRIIPGSRSYRTTEMMAPLPTKPTKWKPIHRKYYSKKPKTAKPVDRKHNRKNHKPVKSKPVYRKHNHKKHKPVKSKPIHRKHNIEKPKPVKSKPIHRKHNTERPKPAKSKLIHGKHNIEKLKPAKPKPIQRKHNIEKLKPAKSKPIQRKHNIEKLKPAKSKPIHRKHSSEKLKPAKSKPIHRKHTIEKLKPAKSKPVHSKHNIEKLNPVEPTPMHRKYDGKEQKPTKSKPADRADISEDSEPMTPKPTAVQEYFDRNADVNKEEQLPQYTEGSASIQRKTYPDETEKEANSQGEVNTNSRTPLGPLMSGSTTTVTFTQYHLVILLINLLFSTGNVFSG